MNIAANHSRKEGESGYKSAKVVDTNGKVYWTKTHILFSGQFTYGSKF